MILFAIIVSGINGMGFSVALSQWAPDWAAAGFGMCIFWITLIGIMVALVLDILEKGRND